MTLEQTVKHQEANLREAIGDELYDLLGEAMDKDKLKYFLESIIVLCAEGVEFMTRTQLAQAVIKEAQAALRILDEKE